MYFVNDDFLVGSWLFDNFIKPRAHLDILKHNRIFIKYDGIVGISNKLNSSIEPKNIDKNIIISGFLELKKGDENIVKSFLDSQFKLCEHTQLEGSYWTGNNEHSLLLNSSKTDFFEMGLGDYCDFKSTICWLKSIDIDISSDKVSFENFVNYIINCTEEDLLDSTWTKKLSALFYEIWGTNAVNVLYKEIEADPSTIAKQEIINFYVAENTTNKKEKTLCIDELLEDNNTPTLMILASSLFDSAWKDLPSDMKKPTKGQLQHFVKTEQGIIESAEVEALIRISKPDDVQFGGNQSATLKPWQPKNKRN
jgi:hypothetical protein